LRLNFSLTGSGSINYKSNQDFSLLTVKSIVQRIISFLSIDLSTLNNPISESTEKVLKVLEQNLILQSDKKNK
jgi:hypothetical protein